MKRLIYLLVLAVVVSGCATTISQVTAPNRANLLKLSIGMTKQEAIEAMGTGKFSASYIPAGGGLMHKRKFVINNPYRSEILKGKDEVFEVIYYATDVKSDDFAISDDELTPLIINEGKLIGWGWSFLDSNIQKYEIRMR